MNISAFVLVMMSAPFVWAGNNMNEQDKKETHILKKLDKIVGEVTVASEFTGTPIIEGTEITFTIKCTKGYKLNSKFKKSDTLNAYDYGIKGKLSTFNVEKSELVIHYRTAIIQEGSPVIDKENSLTIDLSSACTK